MKHRIIIFLLVLLSVFSIINIQADEFTNNNYYYWLLSSINIKEENFNDLAYIESWDIVAAVSKSNNIYYKLNYSNTWEQLKLTDATKIGKIILDPGGNIFIIDNENNLFKKEGLDNDWENINLEYLKYDLPFEIFIASNYLIFINYDNIYIYDVDASSSNNFPNHNHLEVSCLEIIQDENIILAGTRKGLWNIDLISGDQTINKNLPDNINITTLYLSKNKFNPSFISDIEGFVYRSFDNGISWEKNININPDIKINSFLEDETTLKVFFALTDKSILLTYNNGDTWIPMQNGIDNNSSYKGIYHPLEECFYISTSAGIRKSIEIPNVPKPLYPKDGENVFAFKLSLAWQLHTGRGLVGTYKVQVSENNIFDNISFEKNNIIGDLAIIPENTLKYNTKYYWRVLVETPYGISQWSEVYSFTLRHRWVFAQGDNIFKWNEKKFSFDSDEKIYPIINRNFLFIPLRSFIEMQKGLVSWNNLKQEVLVSFKNRNITFGLNYNYYIDNDEKKSFIDLNPDIKPILINNRMFVPLRTLCNIYNWSLEFDSKINSAIVSELNN